MIALKLLVWLFVPMTNAWLDRKGAKRDYLVVNLIRGIVLILYLGGVWKVEGGYDFIHDIGYLLPYVLYCFTSYWILFELLLNKLRGKDWLYYDTVEKDSGWVDRFFAWAGKETHYWIKFLAFVIMLVSILSIYVTNQN